ncbi:SDR family oxidoreductase [Mucilaginibacter sp. FT3.2]|uniref:SDR family oxidoreductase n=1 Tax=Mucilaginibacter sp. FT3.2 TaxID=2723090 RepID=UPI00161F86C6|nr:SDR family oxidoreductase [Mucilaginibacter sp. FT3.2]MBB6232932.1 NAD(P)H dehydrogenase (quinone) [Mucilaginibacter sp. FT3.2]
MILITGATGGLGNATIESLLKKGFQPNEITALVRDENKAADLKNKGVQIKIGNYNDYDSLKAALLGVDKLLLVSSNEMVDRLVQHKNVIDAAIENGVKHIVYTGIDIQNYATTAIPYVSQIHKNTADYLQEVGIPYTILDNTLYADSIGLFSGETFLETGVFFPAGDGKLPWVPKAEMGEAAAVVLTTPGHEDKNYAITANTAYSFGEIAEMVSEITGKEVKYLNPDADTYVEGLVNAGVPKEIASFLAGFGIAIGNGEFDTNRTDLEKLLGRKPTELKEYLAGVYGK